VIAWNRKRRCVEPQASPRGTAAVIAWNRKRGCVEPQASPQPAATSTKLGGSGTETVDKTDQLDLEFGGGGRQTGGVQDGGLGDGGGTA